MIPGLLLMFVGGLLIYLATSGTLAALGENKKAEAVK